MLGLTQPKIVFCENQNINRVREALTQLGLCVPILNFDKHGLESDVERLLLPTGKEKDFK